MYHCNMSAFPQTTTVVSGTDSSLLQMYMAPDNASFVVPANSAVNNTGVTTSQSVPQFYQPLLNGGNPAYNVEISPTPCSSIYGSEPSNCSRVSLLQPSTPVDQRFISITSPIAAVSSPATENRLNDSFPVFDTHLPFKTLFNNLQDQLSVEYVKKTSNATESVPLQPSVCMSVAPSQDRTQKPFLYLEHDQRFKKILPNVSATEAGPVCINQATVAAHEHSLKMKFSQTAKYNQEKIKELSSFLQSQSAQIEMYRLQQLTEAAYPHHKEWLNRQCDSYLHQLMDRVDESLKLIEKCGKENKQDTSSRRKIPQNVLRVLESWYAHHPYPTTEVYQNLTAITGMKGKQVRKWFSNKRCRSKVNGKISN